MIFETATILSARITFFGLNAQLGVDYFINRMTPLALKDLQVEQTVECGEVDLLLELGFNTPFEYSRLNLLLADLKEDINERDEHSFGYHVTGIGFATPSLLLD